MFNIKFKGKFRNEEQLKNGCLPSNAIMFKEPDTITRVFILGTLISLPIIILTLIGLIIKFDGNNFKPPNSIYSLIIIILPFLHEFIHALCFPRNSEKEIWTKFDEGALFVHCNDSVSKKRFIWISIAPNLFLGFIPYILYIIGVFDFSIQASNIIGLISFFMIFAGVGDYLNIYNTIRQVPKGSKVINYGLHSFWIGDLTNY